MWIARYNDGKTVTQKDIDYADLEHSKITSLQLKFRGVYYTLSKSDETQRFFQQRSGRKSMRFTSKKGIKGPIVRGNVDLVKQHIMLVYNNEGDCLGWEVDHTSGEAYKKEGNVLDKGTNLNAFDIPYYTVVESFVNDSLEVEEKVKHELYSFKGDSLPKLTFYEMQADTERASANIGVKIKKDNGVCRRILHQ